jgi:chromate transporter
MSSGAQDAPEQRPLSLPALLLEFLKIGAIGFGGGMAIIAVMEQRLVRKRRAIAAEEFLHGVGLAQVLGPFAVNTSLFVGYRLHGPAGGILSLLAFVAPSMVAVLFLSWLYFAYHTLPALRGAMAGLGAVVIALILAAAWSMGEKAVRGWAAAGLAAAAFLGGLSKTNPLYILIAAGLGGLLLGREALSKATSGGQPTPPPAAGRQPPAAPASLCLWLAGVWPAMPLAKLATAFLKMGCMFLGGGFVVIPVLYQQLVVERGWLSATEFVDGVAISNMTPGPVSVLATFAGYKLSGVAGALAATFSLYLPAIVVMLLLSHGYARAGQGRRAADFLAGIGPAVVGLVAGAAVLLGRNALTSWRSCLLAGVAFLLLARIKAPPALVLAAGALLGITGVVPAN